MRSNRKANNNNNNNCKNIINSEFCHNSINNNISNNNNNISSAINQILNECKDINATNDSVDEDNKINSNLIHAKSCTGCKKLINKSGKNIRVVEGKDGNSKISDITRINDFTSLLSNRIVYGVPVILAVLLYLNTLQAGFVYDDK